MFARFAAAFARRQRAAEAFLDFRDERRRAERAADQFAPPQRPESVRVGLALEKVDKARRAVEERPHADEPVVAPGDMGAHARMRPVPSPRREPRPHRIEPDIARRVDQMLFVERDRAEPALKQVARLARPGVDVAGIEPMRAPSANARPSPSCGVRIR